MTREDYEEQTARPGKFEQCPPWVPYYYNLMLEGRADRDEGRYFAFTVSEEDRALFPELIEGAEHWFYEGDQGFVYECDEPTEDELADAWDDGGDTLIEPAWRILDELEDAPKDSVDSILDRLEEAYRHGSHELSCATRVVSAAECDCVRGEVALVLNEHGRDV